MAAKVDSGLPVIATSTTPRRLRSRQDGVANSSLSPLLEMASTTSAGVTMPRSPWLASAGCTKNAGVPVEARVAAILRPTWPLLPMPITTTRPRQASMACTARAKCSPWRGIRPRSAAASISNVCAANASARGASKGSGWFIGRTGCRPARSNAAHPP
jgi:hypothetical protein